VRAYFCSACEESFFDLPVAPKRVPKRVQRVIAARTEPAAIADAYRRGVFTAREIENIRVTARDRENLRAAGFGEPEIVRFAREREEFARDVEKILAVSQ
jgi:hypothetical protein